MITTTDQIEGMIDDGLSLREIGERIDEMPSDEESKAALWLRAYASQPGFRRFRVIEESWRYHRVAGE